ncbi:MAG: hypothetical protein IKX88_14655 [Thermoguttaceae bacterium]|nr:hypothetical protein [Thermoguttaceae bacterium]MBR5759827.1 hypothetical protein [Thermoguttaceae bacterium]
MRAALSIVVAILSAFFCLNASAQDANPQEKNRSFQEYAPWLDPSLELRDYHIHLRGGMTAEMAAERAKKTGVRSGVLENHGREWPLSTNEKLDEFIAGVEAVNATLPDDEKLKIGIQVNDRDWYKTIDLKVYRRLDYVLADTMIMGKRPDGSDERLWQLPKDYDVNQDEWFERYYKHCMTVVSEPIDILANVTYLPEFIAERYDELWTEERMTALIQAAIDNGVALEIQAESEFPKPKFVELALKMGAKLSFGSNNFDAVMKDASAWKRNIEKFNIQKENLWRDASTK